MGSKEWLLNANALKKAKICITLIEQELGVRLKLTHPQFLDMIKDYAELNDSGELQKAYIELAEFAGASSESISGIHKKVVNMPHFGDYSASSSPMKSTGPMQKSLIRGETVAYHGKTYPKYNDNGLMFKGLYRGQARYA